MEKNESVKELFDSLEQMNAKHESEYYNHISTCKECRELMLRIRDHAFEESKK